MMEFLNQWWDALNFDLQIFYAVAIVSLIVLFFQTLLSLVFGFEEGIDASNLGDHDSGLGIFTVRGVTAFFTGFGWTGVICTKLGLSLPVSVLLAILVGASLMSSLFLMMRAFLKLQSNGNLDYAQSIGQIATVYVTIPPSMKAGGQVQTLLQSRLTMAEAFQKGDIPILPGTKVRIMELISPSTLVVEALS